MYTTNTPRHHTALSNGHLAGTDLTHFSANSTVHTSGSMPGRSNFGSKDVNFDHHAGDLTLLDLPSALFCMLGPLTTPSTFSGLRNHHTPLTLG
jgi:hypothetical protein